MNRGDLAAIFNGDLRHLQSRFDGAEANGLAIARRQLAASPRAIDTRAVRGAREMTVPTNP
jgi:hypothetical protein